MLAYFMEEIHYFLSSEYVFVSAAYCENMEIFNQISGEAVGEVRVVSDMHERKAAMAREAEAFIALPGSFLNNHSH